MEVVIFTAVFVHLAVSVLKGRIVFVRTPLNKGIILFILFASAQYLAGIFSASRFGTIYPYGTKMYLVEIIAYIAAFFVIVNNVHSRRRLNGLMAAIIATGTILAIFGIVQKLAHAPKIFWIRTPPEALLFYSSYLNCNYFAGYLNMVIFLAFGILSAYLSFLDRKKGFYKFDILEGWNGLFLFSITMMIASLFYTFSQGGITVFFITLIFLYCLFWRYSVLKRSVLIFILGCIALPAFLAVAWIQGGMVSIYPAEFVKIFKEFNTYGARLTVWAHAVNMITIRPFFGIGLGAFQHLYPQYRAPSPVYLLKHCHNDYLELIIESGVIGFGIFAVAMYLFFSRYIALLRLRRNGYAVGIGCGCLFSAFAIFLYSFVDYNMHIGANALLFSYIIAIGYVAIHNSSAHDRKETMLFKTSILTLGGPREKLIIFTGLLAIFVYLSSTAVFAGMADIYAESKGDKDGLSNIKKAIALQPDSAEYRYMLAEALFFKKYKSVEVDERLDLQRAAAEIKAAVKMNPKVSKYHRLLGFWYSRNNEDELAVKEFKEAQRLEPLAAINYFMLAVHYFNKVLEAKGIGLIDSRDFEEGVLEYRKALSRDPSVTVDRYKSYLDDYPAVKRALERYSL